MTNSNHKKERLIRVQGEGVFSLSKIKKAHEGKCKYKTEELVSEGKGREEKIFIWEGDSSMVKGREILLPKECPGKKRAFSWGGTLRVFLYGGD